MTSSHHQEGTDKSKQPVDNNAIIARLSHELRTPLASILGYVDLILEEDAGPITEQQKSFLEIILQHTLEMKKKIDEELAFMETGKHPKSGAK